MLLDLLVFGVSALIFYSSILTYKLKKVYVSRRPGFTLTGRKVKIYAISLMYISAAFGLGSLIGLLRSLLLLASDL